VVVLLIPVQNPDGHVKMVGWYRQYVGTRYEGAEMPFLDHRYAGHDNNRDWFLFNLIETRLIVEKVYRAWHPHVVMDIHQMGKTGARLFVPPYAPPIDPNLDPILRKETDTLGKAVVRELTSQGKTGIVFGALYDAWTPARAYPYYHGGVRFLTEVASGELASPVSLDFGVLRGDSYYDPRRPSDNFPLPWRGGPWRLRDIIDYEEAAAWALLKHVARHREEWVRNFYSVGRRAIAPKENPFAYVVPPNQWDPSSAEALLDVLRQGEVEVHRAREPFVADGIEYPAGSHVVFLAQPAGAFAKTLLEVQHYPDLRESPTGRPRPPYDVTAHSLPLLMGVKVVEVRKPFDAHLEKTGVADQPPSPANLSAARYGYLLEHSSTAVFKLLSRLLHKGVEVYWAAEPFKAGGRTYPPGTMIVCRREGIEQEMQWLVGKGSPRFSELNDVIPAKAYRLKLPRVALYQSWIPSSDEGWTRWVFQAYDIRYETVHDADLRQGNLMARFDVIILTSQSAPAIISGHATDRMPPEYCGGIGTQGVGHLREFVERGGTLVALDAATELPIQYFALPVHNRLSGLAPERFYAPGVLLRLLVDPSHPIGYGMPQEAACMFLNSPGFETHSGRVVAKYPAENPLLSGWLIGSEHLANRAALVELPLGSGKVILIGFRPQFRGWTRGTFRMLFNCIYYGPAVLTSLP